MVIGVARWVTMGQLSLLCCDIIVGEEFSVICFGIKICGKVKGIREIVLSKNWMLVRTHTLIMFWFMLEGGMNMWTFSPDIVGAK